MQLCISITACIQTHTILGTESCLVVVSSSLLIHLLILQNSISTILILFLITLLMILLYTLSLIRYYSVGQKSCETICWIGNLVCMLN
jgi:hypothetical protein